MRFPTRILRCHWGHPGSAVRLWGISLTTFWGGKTHTLFELSLETGKKNQIRAHLQFHNYPIVGDFDHNSKENPFNRLCLHAKTLEFIHPITKEKMRFDVPAPKEWFNFCSRGAEN